MIKKAVRDTNRLLVSTNVLGYDLHFSIATLSVIQESLTKNLYPCDPLYPPIKQKLKFSM